MKLGEITRFQEGSRCLNCRKMLDSHTEINEEIDEKRSPNPGDITVCSRCGHIMIYNKQLKFRKPTDKELIEIAGDKRIVKLNEVREAIFEKDKRSKLRPEETRQQRRARERKASK